MKLCSECRKTPLPYIIPFFIAGFSAFLTWLTLAAAGVDPESNRWWTGGVFVSVLGLLTGYMLACMRRHCTHQDHVHG